MGGYYDRDGSAIGMMEWALRFEDESEKVVDHDVVGPDVQVSTVWLGLDHNFAPSGPPLIFETMIFGGEHDDWQARYSTEDDARAGHAAAVAWVRGEGSEPS